ncbi:MAG: RHS repeat-associated core domain-containing protein, partial [Coriobacteriia bacterium]|nr:RHS repeat-associated core domain-containing protein [Coriobacteriia bacterium]
STIGELNPFRYRGYYYDSETGLYYLNARYYDPEVGRFISADSLMSTGQGVLGNNMFAYCGNNTVMHTDSSGTSWSMSTLDWGAIGRTAFSLLLIAVGIALCYVPGAQVAGVALITLGACGIAGGIAGAATGYGYNNGWDLGTFVGSAAAIAIMLPEVISILSSLSFSVTLPAFGFSMSGGTLAVVTSVTTTVAIPIGKIVVAGAIALGAGLIMASDRFIKEQTRGMSQNQKEKFKRRIENEKAGEGRGGADNLPLDRIKDIANQIKREFK